MKMNHEYLVTVTIMTRESVTEVEDGVLSIVFDGRKGGVVAPMRRRSGVAHPGTRGQCETVILTTDDLP
jgi:hypothetical protein